MDLEIIVRIVINLVIYGFGMVIGYFIGKNSKRRRNK